MPERRGSTIIENVQPQLDGGRFPVKRVAGEAVRITADIFKEGHDDLTAVVRWRQLTPQATEPREEPMRFLGNDAWEAELPLTGHGLYAFSIEAWPDSFRTWAHERKRAVFSSWYEFFPRSTSGDPKHHGTFRDAERMLPYVGELGFDVVYLPPIHPIGRTARKGKNNALTAAPDDVGSPWAIGGPE